MNSDLNPTSSVTTAAPAPVVSTPQPVATTAPTNPTPAPATATAKPRKVRPAKKA